MNRLTLLAIILCTSITAYSQNVNVTSGSSYKLENKIKVNKWVDGTTCDTSQSVDICANNKIKITRILEDGKVLIKSKTTFFQPSVCPTAPNKFDTYCVDKSVVNNNVILPKITPTFGVLTVPFRYEPKSSKIFAGGQIGGYLGIQTRLKANPVGKDIYGFIGGTAGYSRIPLNNVNATNPENVDEVGAFGYGGVAGLTIGSFQAVFVLATDRYNVNDEKQSRNWLSIGLGYSFIKPPTE